MVAQVGAAVHVRVLIPTVTHNPLKTQTRVWPLKIRSSDLLGTIRFSGSRRRRKGTNGTYRATRQVI